MISAYLDRFEGEHAVLLLGDEMKKLHFPKIFLPKDMGEGDYFLLDVKKDEERTASAEDEALAFSQEDV